MSTRERAIDKTQKMPEPYLPELYEIIQEFEAAKQETSVKPSLMAKLRSIKISAPRDFCNHLRPVIQKESCAA